jgi:sugar O-acyltransferase (sialic acid O-acetyltransferase NeuD family)
VRGLLFGSYIRSIGAKDSVKINGKNEFDFERFEVFFKKNPSSRVVILGNQGLSKEVFSVLISLNLEYLEIAFIDKSDEHLLRKGDIAFLGMGSPIMRAQCFQKYTELLHFPILLHKSSMIGNEVTLGNGTFIQSGVSITTQVEIGKGCLVNMNSTIGHDVSIGDFTIINPGATLSGNVSIGTSVLIGANATVLENISIGDGARIGAGAVVTKNVQEGQTVIGNPARPM